MTTPANRVPVRIARGSKANLDTAMAAGDLKEGEVCYAADENGLYVVESGALTQAGADLASTSIDALSDVDTTSTAPVDGQALIWNNSASQWEPGDVDEIEWTLTANGSNDYIFAGPGFAGTETDPAIYVMRGQTYKFTNGMGAHPFQIQSTSGTSGTAYNDGITNNAVSNGTLTWEVRMDAPSTLYYQCTSHAAMAGTIYVLGGGTITSIDDIDDVDTTSSAPTDGQVLTWVDANSKWEPADAATGGGGGGASVLPFDAILKYTNGDATVAGEWQYWNNFGANDLYLNPTDSTGVDTSDLFDYLDDSNSVTHIWHSGDNGSTWTKRSGTFFKSIGVVYYEFDSTAGESPVTGDQWFTFADPDHPNRISSNVDVDTATTPPTDGQVLAWVAANSQWEPADAATGGGAVDSVNGQTGVVDLALDDLNDVDSAGGVAVTPDLLLYGEGTDGGTTFTDSSSNAYAMSIFQGSPTTSTTQFKYGSASLYFPGSASIQVASTTDTAAIADMGSGDFTVEFWAYPTAASSSLGCLKYGSSSTIQPSWFINLNAVSSQEALNFWYSTDGSSSTFVNGTTTKTLLNTWTHFAVCRSGGYLRGYVDGVEVFNQAISGSIATQSTYTLKIGEGNGSSLTGYMDNVRIANGTAAYTAPFDPPNAAFTTGPADGQVLTWVAANNQWEPADANARLDGIGDVKSYADVDTRGEWDTKDSGNVVNEDSNWTATVSGSNEWVQLSTLIDGVDHYTELDGLITGSATIGVYNSADDSLLGTFSVVAVSKNSSWQRIDFRAAAGSAAFDALQAHTGGIYIAIGGTVWSTGSTAGVTDGQALTWVAANSQWEPADLQGAAVRTALGIGEYVDDAAAGTGGVASGAMYYNTTSSDYRLKS